jgi:hypothetical protein
MLQFHETIGRLDGGPPETRVIFVLYQRLSDGLWHIYEWYPKMGDLTPEGTPGDEIPSPEVLKDLEVNQKFKFRTLADARNWIHSVEDKEIKT